MRGSGVADGLRSEQDVSTQMSLRFALLLRACRREAGLTQEGLAERAGLAWRTISDLERGVKLPRRTTVALLAEALALVGERRAAFDGAVQRQGPVGGTSPLPHWILPADHPVRLVGRAPELAVLEQHLAGQGPPLLLLAGQPGIGKSRLLQEAASRAGNQARCVLAGGCSRAGGPQPFAPLMLALQGFLAARTAAERRSDLRGCAWLVRLLPELVAGEIEPLPAWTLPPEQERRLIFAAVVRCLGNVAGSAGTLLLLDDLQWAGADAIELLARLLREGHGAPLRVVGAYRDTDVDADHPLVAAVAELAEAQLVRRRSLGPLAAADAQELFAQLVSDQEQARSVLAAEVAERAGGVPFFLVSYARSLADEADGEPFSLRIPWDLRESIRRRLTAVAEPARALLALAAVIGRVLPRSVLLAVLEWPKPEVLAALESACRAGLLEELDDGYGFVHDVIHEVVVSDLGLARRCLLHRTVAVVLEEQGGKVPAAVLGYHFREAGEPARAVIYLEQAGDLAAARYAHALAADQYHHLVCCLEGMGEAIAAARAREKLAGALIAGARYDEALGVLERLAEILQDKADLQHLGRVMAMIVNVHATAYRETLPAVLERLRPIIEALECSGPSASLAEVHFAMAGLFTNNGQPDRALVATDRVAEVGRVLGDCRLQSSAGISRSCALLSLNRADEALSTIEEAVRLAEQERDVFGLALGLSVLAWIHEERGEYEQCTRVAERALPLAEQVESWEGIVWNIDRLGCVAFYTGDWPRACTHFDHAMAVARRAAITLGHAHAQPLFEYGRLRMAEGAWEEGTCCLEGVLTLFADSGESVLRRGAQGQLAERDVLIGNPAAACARLIPLLDRSGLEERWVAEFILPVLAWARFELGETEQANAIAAEAVRRARAGHFPLGLVQALRVKAMVLLTLGCWVEAEQCLEEGLALARSMPYPHGEGRLLVVSGRLCLAREQIMAARERLEEALAIFGRLGARKDLEQAEQLLTTLG